MKPIGKTILATGIALRISHVCPKTTHPYGAGMLTSLHAACLLALLTLLAPNVAADPTPDDLAIAHLLPENHVHLDHVPPGSGHQVGDVLPLCNDSGPVTPWLVGSATAHCFRVLSSDAWPHAFIQQGPTSGTEATSIPCGVIVISYEPNKFPFVFFGHNRACTDWIFELIPGPNTDALIDHPIDAHGPPLGNTFNELFP